MSEIIREMTPPDTADPLFAPFWEGTAGGELRIQRCEECRTWHWPPRFVCRNCGSTELGWQAVPARGTLYSWIVVGRSMSKAFPEVPYAVGIVELDEPAGIRVVGNIAGIAPDALQAGQALAARFSPAGRDGKPEIHTIEWRPE